MRRAAKVDSNHRPYVEHIESRGFSTESLAALGRGAADVLIAKDMAAGVIEFKVRTSRRIERTNELQKRWHARWRGKVFIARTFAELDAAIDSIAAGRVLPGAITTENEEATIVKHQGKQIADKDTP